MRHASLRGSAAALFTATGLLFVLAATASAETFHVSSATQLEEAVTSANGDCAANTIVLSAGDYLPSRALTFTDTCGTQTVEGPTHAPEAVIDGGNEEVEHPELIVIDEHAAVAFKDLVVDHGGGGPTPAVEDFGALAVEASTIGGNHSVNLLVEPGGAATLSNSTLSDGSSSGLVNIGSATLSNVTVAFNKSNGIENVGTLDLHNTIVAENGSAQCVGAAPAVSDHTLSSDSTCGAEISNANPDLGPLFNNGGGTQLHSLQPGSPAIDAGNPETCTSTDQEGQPRPDVPATACDIGADEWNATAPTITAPSEVTKEATGPSGAAVTYSASASSALAGIRSFSCSPKSGSTFAIGETTVTCSATDGHGNKATSTIKVIVTDKTPPVISGIPATIEKEATSASGAEVTYTNPSATDIVDGTVPVICTPASGSTFAIGETTVKCTATDSHGNTAEASFKVIVTGTHILFKEWILTGSLTDHKLGQALFSLPSGSRFNGQATIPGALEGNTTVPAFTATTKLLGLIPVTVGYTFTEAGPVTGTTAADPAHPGNVLIKATAKDTIGITSVAMFGLKLPTSCLTKEPATFPLEASETTSQLSTKGATFTGSTTLPAIQCTGGLLGSAFGSVLTALISGPSNPFTLGIEP